MKIHFFNKKFNKLDIRNLIKFNLRPLLFKVSKKKNEYISNIDEIYSISKNIKKIKLNKNINLNIEPIFLNIKNSDIRSTAYILKFEFEFFKKIIFNLGSPSILRFGGKQNKFAFYDSIGIKINEFVISFPHISNWFFSKKNINPDFDIPILITYKLN